MNNEINYCLWRRLIESKRDVKNWIWQTNLICWMRMILIFLLHTLHNIYSSICPRKKEDVWLGQEWFQKCSQWDQTFEKWLKIRLCMKADALDPWRVTHFESADDAIESVRNCFFPTFFILRNRFPVRMNRTFLPQCLYIVLINSTDSCVVDCFSNLTKLFSPKFWKYVCTLLFSTCKVWWFFFLKNHLLHTSDSE